MAGSMKSNCNFRSMNPWVLHLQKLGLELKCPLCLNLLKRPFLLPCDHIFCNSCLPERTQFGSECSVCKAQYVDRDLRPMPSIENIVTIYRSLDASFCANLFQSTSSDSGRNLETYPTSRSVDCFDKLINGSFKAAGKDNSSCPRSVCSLAGTRLHHDGVQKTEMADKCNLQRGFRNNDYEMAGSGGDEGDAKQCVNSLHMSSQTRVGGVQECETMQVDTHQVDQLSAGSPPSSGDIKSLENDSYDQGGDSPQNYKVLVSVKRTPDDSTRQERPGSSASGTEGVNSRDSKRHKKLNYGSLNICTNNVGRAPISLQTDNLGTCDTQSEPISLSPCKAQPPALLLDSSIVKTVCGFCQSSKVSEDTGPMLHFVDRKLVEGDEASLSNAIHVHSICIEWAPQVYFDGDGTVKNLSIELARGAKLKCSRCGLKGAALGCYQKSCRRSYHVICATKITGCRWDNVNFLYLCPSHTSVRFPDEKKSKTKKPQSRHTHLPTQLCHVPAQIAPQESNFWAESINGAKEWVFCGSALSSEEKCLLVEFGSMIGVPITKFWRPNVTHLIAATDTKGACTRTLKVLLAILNGKWVLTIDWVKACMKSMHPVDEEAYEVSLDNHGCHNGPRTGRLSVLNNAPKLFNGFNFYFVGDFVSGYKDDVQILLIAAGGNVLKSKEELQGENHEQAAPSRSLIVYNMDPPQGCKLGEEVTLLWERLNEAEDLAAKFGSQVIGHTWILESIASCKLQPFASLHSTDDANNLLV